jgi:hypothetical protein
MKAIITTYHGPTSTKPTRIIAHDEDGNRAIVSRDTNDRVETSHEQAARALCAKMDWHGKLAVGWLSPDSRVFIWFDGFVEV